jgi:hypothetical protein
MVVDVIRVTLTALNLPILESKMAAVPVEEQRRERELSWCFLTAEVNPNEAVAIADLVRKSFDLFGDRGCASIVQKNEVVLLTWAEVGFSNISLGQEASTGGSPELMLKVWLGPWRLSAHVSSGACSFWCCENIHSWISLCGDLVFSHQHGIYGFKFPKRCLEISSRDLTLFSILII